MTMTKRAFEDIVDRALKGLSGSSKNRLAICELVEHVEAMMAAMNSPTVQTVQVVRPAVRTESNGMLILDNNRLRQELEEVTHYANRLRELIGKVDEHH